MHRFAVAASRKAHLSVAKHNAEYEVRHCAQKLQVKQGQLQDVITSLRTADKNLDNLWESALNSNNGAGGTHDSLHPVGTEVDDAGSTGSNDSA